MVWNPSRMENHNKFIFSHTLHFKARNHANTLHKMEYHESHRRWIYLTTFLNKGERQKICILYGHPCDMDFSYHKSPNPTPSRLRWMWDSETSGEKSISHEKPYTMHFVAYFTPQGMLIILNTLCKVEDVWKPCEMDLSHNCEIR